MTTSRKHVFNEDSELYDRARPGYPAALFDDLARDAQLRDGSSVLEVGCGTGQATQSLAARGYHITCVELGESLAAVASRQLSHFPNVTVVNSAFEDWPGSADSFDLIFAATSWHWLEPSVAFPKAVRLLHTKGKLAIVTTHHVVPADGDSFWAEIQPAYEAIGRSRIDRHDAPDEVADKTSHIEGSGLFEVVAVHTYLSTRSYSADEYIDVLNTYSDHRTMDSHDQQSLYDAYRTGIAARRDRRVTKHYLNILHVAQAIADP